MCDQISDLLKATEGLAYHRESVARLEQEISKIRPQVDTIIQSVADRFLVDGAGRPVDGGVYWYSRQAIVRVGEVITIIPMAAMSEEKIFNPEPSTEPVQTNGHREPDFVAVMLKEEALAEAEEDEDARR